MNSYLGFSVLLIVLFIFYLDFITKDKINYLQHFSDSYNLAVVNMVIVLNQNHYFKFKVFYQFKNKDFISKNWLVGAFTEYKYAVSSLAAFTSSLMVGMVKVISVGYNSSYNIYFYKIK